MTSIVHGFAIDKQTEIQVKKLFETSKLIEEYFRHSKRITEEKTEILRIYGLEIFIKRCKFRNRKRWKDRRKQLGE